MVDLRHPSTPAAPTNDDDADADLVITPTTRPVLPMTAAVSGRPVCPRCRRPVPTCYCEHVVELTTKTRVLVLQHPRERDVPINTARIAALCLPQSILRVGVDFERDDLVRNALHDSTRPAVLLFPGPTSLDLVASPPPGPVTLVVLDGTWSQAAKLLKLNPSLSALPRYSITPSRPSEYRIRRQPADHCVATIEALADVLGVLDGDSERFQALRRPFVAMADRQLEFARTVRGTRTRHARAARVPKPRPVPPELVDATASLVLVYGEANAFPYGTSDAPPPEIVHWVATRLSTGESFEARPVPSGRLAPSVDRHSGLSRDSILAGESVSDFLARWERFLRDDDILCTWGDYAADILQSQGASSRRRLCLRRAMTRFLGDKPGALEFLPARLGTVPPPAMFPGRSGMRLAALQSVVETLIEAARSRSRMPRA